MAAPFRSACRVGYAVGVKVAAGADQRQRSHCRDKAVGQCFFESKLYRMNAVTGVASGELRGEESGLSPCEFRRKAPAISLARSPYNL